jgi:transposase-like protein
MGAQIIRYSEAFKRKVVEGLEKGELRNQLEARQRYGIGGGSTIHRWLRKYGKNHLVAKVVKVESMKERDQLKQLKRKIRERELEKALADTKVEQVLERAYFEVLCEEMGIEDTAAYKKKLAGKVFTKGE